MFNTVVYSFVFYCFLNINMVSIKFYFNPYFFYLRVLKVFYVPSSVSKIHNNIICKTGMTILLWQFYFWSSLFRLFIIMPKTYRLLHVTLDVLMCDKTLSNLPFHSEADQYNTRSFLTKLDISHIMVSFFFSLTLCGYSLHILVVLSL